ncbi:MAG: retroviral-like aspartic protease family protein [Defluviitaleaceae bacterium]|nr:retroviral-like aspartic protease family protein [Defluviitaleaceae bacterium]MCL2262009.1 retroviral-like aspartic protease family protein [Defluviitaleaceae bacterium]
MGAIIIPFEFNSLGRVDFNANVMTSDFKSFKGVRFKLDSGSDFTTIDSKDLYNLGYTHKVLERCPFHHLIASTASSDIRLQYIQNVSIKFSEHEIQNCRIFFALDSQLRSLFGSDILKYFNWGVNYDNKILQLDKTKNMPVLSEGEKPLQIYTIENSGARGKNVSD